MQYFAYAFCLIGLIALLLLIFSPKLFKQKRKSLWDSPDLKYQDAAWNSCADGKIKPWNASCEVAISKEEFYKINKTDDFFGIVTSNLEAWTPNLPLHPVTRINQSDVKKEVLPGIISGEIPSYRSGSDVYFTLINDFVFRGDPIVDSSEPCR